MNAYVLVQTDGRDGPIARRIQTVRGVMSAEDISGPYDALALTRFEPDGLALDAIVAEIRGLPGVLRALAAPLVQEPREVQGGRAA